MKSKDTYHEDVPLTTWQTHEVTERLATILTSHWSIDAKLFSDCLKLTKLQDWPAHVRSISRSRVSRYLKIPQAVSNSVSEPQSFLKIVNFCKSDQLLFDKKCIYLWIKCQCYLLCYCFINTYFLLSVTILISPESYIWRLKCSMQSMTLTK